MIFTFFYLLMLVPHNLAEFTTAVYEMSRDVDGSYEDEAYHTAEGWTLSQCNNWCTSDSECESVIFDDNQNRCYLFSRKLNITSSTGQAGASYSEKVDCKALNTNLNVNPVTEKGQNCCYLSESLYCLPNGKVYKDCQDAFDRGERDTDTVHYLRPNWGFRTVKAVCQFDSTYGWTVIQRRVDDSVDFYRNWNEYSLGFGNLSTSYWIGLEAIYFLVRTGNRNLSIVLEAHDGEIRTANYSTFYIDGVDKDYALHLNGYSGDTGDSMAYHNGKPFSTYDRDNDEHSSRNCAEDYSGAWWYNLCHRANLNGIWYEDGKVTTMEPTGASWFKWKGHEYSYKTIHIRVGR